MGHYWPMVIKKIKQGQTVYNKLQKFTKNLPNV